MPDQPPDNNGYFEQLFQQFLMCLFDTPARIVTNDTITVSNNTPSNLLFDNDTLFPQQHNQALNIYHPTGPSLSFHQVWLMYCLADPSLSFDRVWNIYRLIIPSLSFHQAWDIYHLTGPSLLLHQSRRSSPDRGYSSPTPTPPPPSPSPPPRHRRRREPSGDASLRGSNTRTRGKARYKCPQCERTYSREQDVRRHLSSHSNERNELCSYCPRSFRRHDILMRHERGCRRNPFPQHR